MAKVQNNIFVRGLSGSLGEQFVVRKGKGGDTIIANKPTFSDDRTFNSNQLAVQDSFRMAIAYARTAKTQEVYVQKAQGTNKSAYNLAVADWFNQPQVLELDLSNWLKGIGQPIRVQAQDDTYVAKVHVVISGPNNALLEEGEAVRADGLWWVYTSTKAVTTEGSYTVIAKAFDLAGNVAEKTAFK